MWKIVLSCLALFSVNSGWSLPQNRVLAGVLPGDNVIPEDVLEDGVEDDFIPLFHGPQTRGAAVLARNALHGEHFGGDILGDISEAGIKDPKYRWPGYPGKGEVPYVIESSLSSQKDLILSAMDQYHRLTCIRFVERKSERNYITIGLRTGCSSYVGMQNTGAQPVNLDDGCHYIGTVVHELGHAVGLFHEHQRSDRDTYITVYENNVIQGLFYNFNRTNPNEELIFTSYDYSSIMHYGNYAFSKSPGVLKTMEAKNGVRLIEPYDKTGLTDKDIETVRKLYQCK